MSEDYKGCPICGYELITKNRWCRRCSTLKYINDPTKQTGIEYYRKRSHENYNINTYVCHVCRYFMHHPLFTCSICSGKLIKIEMLPKEFVERFQDYKEDW